MSLFGIILVCIFVAFSRIRTEYGEILDQTNSEYGHFLRSVNSHFWMKSSRTNRIAYHFAIWKCSCCRRWYRCFNFDDLCVFEVHGQVKLGFQIQEWQMCWYWNIFFYHVQWHALALLIYSFIMTSREVYIWNIFWKVSSSAKIVCVYDNFL